jgi:transcriptional regulator with XRE-family HTH domain
MRNRFPMVYLHHVNIRRPAVTIGDVAAAAGVSRATVSRVMNGRSTVAQDIAERVRQAAESLSYRPSTAARNLALGRTRTVALVMPDVGNPVFQQILHGVMAAADQDGYRVLVADTAENQGQEAAIALEARLRCDALVLVSPRMSDDDLARLVPDVEPVVLVNRELPRTAGAHAPAAPGPSGAGPDAAPLARINTITRLGQGVNQSRRLAPEAIDRTTAVLEEYGEVMDTHGVDRLRMTATSAWRARSASCWAIASPRIRTTGNRATHTTRICRWGRAGCSPNRSRSNSGSRI